MNSCPIPISYLFLKRCSPPLLYLLENSSMGRYLELGTRYRKDIMGKTHSFAHLLLFTLGNEKSHRDQQRI